MTRKILVTSALPYANGPIHLGHLVEYIQTDIWVRFQKLQGNECWYVCADDAHGTPIMLKARERGITPQALIEQIGTEHRRDFAGFNIGFDNYYTTHSDENRYFSELIYTRLRDGGWIDRQVITQAYDEREGMFLPDRYIKGTCPRCGADDQYGDNCEACGASYSPDELKNPVSVVSGEPPVQKESEHYFFRLQDFESMLREWAGSEGLQEEVANKLQEWFDAGLRAWDISRDAPYFGFEIPDARASISMSGWTPPSATWRASRISATARAWILMPGGRPTPMPSSITSSARTLFISMPFSGRRCCRVRAFAPRPGSAPMGS